MIVLDLLLAAGPGWCWVAGSAAIALACYLATRPPKDGRGLDGWGVD